ncbi:DUF4395 domain-containing protein [Mucilaginibacter sp. X4EP1]|uniref:DUF4395 domain-containing protein n=1 Tax=Mucilaginibacter sp. X4EP1 TaxID=2723092 RepID=UPI002168503D|nr:DUF4395 domain-containing protein [Mucilaginibacter sp. X4EP1]MCS3814679.1 magnesium-transporting ATPase (P-type) [Mucilaginibacter sp. X4EP1]
MMNEKLNCPVDFVKVDENRVRVTAFFVIVFSVLYVVTGVWIIPALLLVDFALRAFNLNTYSPLASLSGIVVKQMDLKPKPVDRAPKRFAAYIGFGFLILIVIALFTNLIIESKILAGVIILFASLESFVGFCAGCYVYTLINRFKFQVKGE